MTHKQTQALAALLTHPTKSQAAAAAGIGLTTLKRYLDDPSRNITVDVPMIELTTLDKNKDQQTSLVNNKGNENGDN